VQFGEKSLFSGSQLSSISGLVSDDKAIAVGFDGEGIDAQ
jgi:hypothetical protein